MKKLLAYILCITLIFSTAGLAFADEPEITEPAQPDVTVPEKPEVPKAAGLRYSLSSKNYVTLSWDAVSGADGYVIYRYSRAKKEYIVYHTVESAEITSFTCKRHKEDRTYYYKVKAYALYEGEKVFGEASDIVKIKTKILKPGKVHHVNARGIDWNKVKITWDKAENATGYKVYRYNKSKRKYVLIKTIKGANKTKYIDKGRYVNTRYTYKVRAIRKIHGTEMKGKRSAKDRARTLKTVKGLKLLRPLKHHPVGSGYGWRGGAFHIGADYGAAEGTPVYAATSGYVYRSRANYGGLGNGIVIKNKKGVTTWYGHLSKRCVSQGSYVKKGQLIGRVGHTGYTDVNHLHYEVWVNGHHYNPEKFY